MKTVLFVLLCTLPLFCTEFTSKYFDFDEDKAIGYDAEHQGSDGFEEYPMESPYYVRQNYAAQMTYRSLRSHNDARMAIYLSPQNGAYQYYYGKLIEWRYADNKPFAVIYRVTSVNDERKEYAQHLIVRSLDGKLSKNVDVKATKNANSVARELADSYYKINN